MASRIVDRRSLPVRNSYYARTGVSESTYRDRVSNDNSIKQHNDNAREVARATGGRQSRDKMTAYVQQHGRR